MDKASENSLGYQANDRSQSGIEVAAPRKVGSNLVSVEWLDQHLGTPGLVVLCASMGNAEKSRANGIPGALLADIEGEFSDHDQELPHTAPSDMARILEKYGISDDSTVVVYDRHGILAAPRVWWLVKSAGIENAVVLDGGLKAWKAAGKQTVPIAEPGDEIVPGAVTSTPRPEMLVGLRAVESALARSLTSVVDARSAGRFAGTEPEPRPGLHGGHIPGSVNLPYTELLEEDGTMKSPEELRALFEKEVGESRNLVFSCGSGVTACIDALAAAEAGYSDLAVYDGSWSEWGNPELGQPIGPQSAL